MKKKIIVLAMVIVLTVVILPINTLATASDDSINHILAEQNELTEVQKNSTAMMNYLAVLSQEINNSSNSRLYLEKVYSQLISNTYPNAVDELTQERLNDLLDIIKGYRMIDIKRERLQYLYEQQQARMLRSAVPNPLGLLSSTNSFRLDKLVTSIVFMAVDSITSYQYEKSQIELEYLQSGWELNDQEEKYLAKNCEGNFNYIIDMVQEYHVPGDLTLDELSVKRFVENASDSNITSRLQFLTANQQTYAAFGKYWLVLAETYYLQGNFNECLNSISVYETIQPRILKKDRDLARTLPLAIAAAEKTQVGANYEETALHYLELMEKNSDIEDWELRYFMAQTYVDLYARTKRNEYLQQAYDICINSVNELKKVQHAQNAAYITPLKERKVDIPKDATKERKEELKEYNKMLDSEYKIQLPPAYEPLVLNCDLLFALANELHISDEERARIDKMLRDNGKQLFLSTPLDQKYLFAVEESKATEEIGFDGKKLIIPACLMTGDYMIQVTVKDNGNTINYSDWTVEGIKRKEESNVDTYVVTCSSKEIKKQKYTRDSKVKVEIYAMQSIDLPVYEAEFKAVDDDYVSLPKGNKVYSPIITFERVR